MKKYIIPGLVVVAFGIYVLLNRQQSTDVISVPVTPTSTTAGIGASASSSPSGVTPVKTPVTKNPPPVPTSVVAGVYKNGSYKGSVADAYFGKLQVEAIISGGKLTDVQFLTFPNDSGHTQAISRTSLPILKQEAIQAQSANVNIVSGATQTSQAFQQSLASALALAKN